MKSMTIFISALLVSIYFVDRGNVVDILGLNIYSPWWTRLTYMLCHGSIIHLSVNVYSLLIIAFMAKSKLWQAALSIIISTTLPDATLVSTGHVIGISTYIYAMTGILIMNSNEWAKLLFINMLFILFAAILPNTNIAYLPHLYCLCGGILVGIITSKRHG